ncbi:hypothetical protein O1D97_06660 [Marinomonas sp. 15G1-11]|uniref:Glycosyltransferase RgtA/B/C/D-like domain-containing protein n=1 Tax=Marinomonas phaeophyticola TaxID=3004091 RepID=A0ABT4JSV5_9GAMM|nr:hypothetical protein [Marinomonas sp. 15G1-11]MCZ2721336.1 hypothetical protein [Marinomonas sp. 15G1-11]
MKVWPSPIFYSLALSSFLIFFSQFSALSWGTFSDDDTHMSQLSLSYGWLAPYFIPEVYQQLSIVHFTPAVLTLYKAVLTSFGFNNVAFIIVQLTLISLIGFISAYLCAKKTQSSTAGFACLLLIYSNMSMFPMISRFYTVHYLLGALISVLILLLIYRAWYTNKLNNYAFLISLFILSLFALLSKEIYIMLIPLLWCVFWKVKAGKAFVLVTLSLIVYFCLRFYILGVSTDGRDGEGFVSSLMSLSLDSWIGFLTWYVTNKWLICLAVFIALLYTPKKMLMYSMMAGLFAAPSLAAPHAFQNPELHGDRVFFMFDLALSIASILAIFSSDKKRIHLPLTFQYAAFCLPLIALLFIQRQELVSFAKSHTSTPSYLINEQLIHQLEKKPTLVLTPLSYLQGEIMNIYRLLGKDWLEITQNCQQFISRTKLSTATSFLAFDQTGQRVSLEQVQKNCQPSQNHVNIKKPPTFKDGVLSWSLDPSNAESIGILFPDRGIAVEAAVFKQRLVRPKPNETYQVYKREHGNSWWFSEIMTIQVIP